METEARIERDQEDNARGGKIPEEDNARKPAHKVKRRPRSGNNATATKETLKPEETKQKQLAKSRNDQSARKSHRPKPNRRTPGNQVRNNLRGPGATTITGQLFERPNGTSSKMEQNRKDKYLGKGPHAEMKDKRRTPAGSRGNHDRSAKKHVGSRATLLAKPKETSSKMEQKDATPTKQMSAKLLDEVKRNHERQRTKWASKRRSQHDVEEKPMKSYKSTLSIHDETRKDTNREAINA